MREFKNPQNMGRIEDADGVGTVGNPVCGDMLRLFIKVEDDRIVDIKVETFGCVAAIATSSMTTQMAMGKTIEEAKTITRKMVADALDGLPPHKMHCSNLAAEALQKAIEDYESKTQGKEKGEKRP
jgi:nitrogen fixation NifU-like protein